MKSLNNINDMINKEFIVNGEDFLSIRSDVINYLVSKKEQYPIFSESNVNIFTLNWNWNIGNDVYYFGSTKMCGSLAKRIRKFLNIYYDINLSDDDMGELGEVLRVARNKTTQFHCKFVDNFDWNPGDFGDYNSCFWTQKKLAKEALLKAGAKPILFYKNGDGVARAITINYKDYLIIFNAYGMNLLEITKILARHFNCVYQTISLTNEDDPHNLIHINNNIGNILYDKTKQIKTTDITLRIDVSKYEICNCCYQLDRRKKMRVDVKGDYYCNSCLKCRVFNFECRLCGNFYVNKPGYKYSTEEMGNSYVVVCKNCYDNWKTTVKKEK